MKKKLVSILLILSMVIISFAGCGKNNKDNNANTNTANTGGSSKKEESKGSDEVKKDDTATSEKPDPFGKYEGGLDIHFARQTDENMYDNALANLPGQTVEDNMWLDTYRDELGINVIYDWMVKGSNEYEQKVNVVIASGDLPDVMEVTSTQLMQLAEAGMIEDMTDVYEQYAADFTREVMYQEGDASFKAAQKDGRLYGIPVTMGSYESVDLMWIRADWLKNLNLEVPKTVDELVNVIEKFTTGDPDGNGKNDTYGIGVAGSPRVLTNNFGSLTGFFNAFGAYPTIWYEKDGQLVYGATQKECKEALRVLQDLYAKGYINPEFGVMDARKAGEGAASGQVGLTFGAQWLPLVYFHSNYAHDTNAAWSAYQPVSATGDPVTVSANQGTYRWLVVRKGFENPEAVVKMVNLFIEKCWGETGDNGKYYAPPHAESIWKLSPVQTSMPMKNIMAYRDITEATKNNTTDQLKGEAKSIWDKLDTYYKNPGAENSMQWGWERIYGPDPSSYSQIDAMATSGRILVNMFSGAPTETMVEKMSTLNAMRDEIFTKIIMGDASLDDFDKFVEEFNKLGGEQITKEVNEWYKSVK